MNGENEINQFPINDKPSKGPVLGIIIIVLLIILGGVYILSSRSGESDNIISPPTDSPAGRDGETTIPSQPPRDPADLSDLEAEAQTLETDLLGLDQEADQ